MRAISGSVSPAPAAIVSAACASGVSPSPIAAAMPPCAQVEEAPSPSGFGLSTVTGSGASLSAVNSPARPPPMTSTRCGPARRWNFNGCAIAVPPMALSPLETPSKPSPIGTALVIPCALRIRKPLDTGSQERRHR